MLSLCQRSRASISWVVGQASAAASSSITQSTPCTRRPLSDGNLTEVGISGQQDPAIRQRSDQTETVVCRQGAMMAPEREGLRDFSWCEVVGSHPVAVEVLPFLAGEVEDFRRSYGQRNHEPVRKSAERFQ